MRRRNLGDETLKFERNVAINASELPFLLMRPGSTAPVFQYRLLAYEPELNPC